MKGTELKKQAELYVSTAIEDENACVIINEALVIIGEKSDIFGRITVDVNNTDEWYRLPPDSVRLINVITLAGAEFHDYETRGFQIRFKITGTFVMSAQRMPLPITNIDDDIDLHPLFLQAIVTYLRSFIKLKDKDTSQDGKELKQQFYAEIKRASEVISLVRKRMR